MSRGHLGRCRETLDRFGFGAADDTPFVNQLFDPELDEWAAGQDSSFKKWFHEQFLFELKKQGKCVVVISHDDQCFNLADRIVKLTDGKIVAT